MYESVKVYGYRWINLIVFCIISAGNTVPGQIERFNQICPFNLALYKKIGGWCEKF